LNTSAGKHPNPLPAGASDAGPADETASLYAIGIQLQSISHEISKAAELLASDEEDERLAAIELLESYLAAEHSSVGALSTKADRLLIFCDHLIRQATFRKEQALRLTALAKADEVRVTRLHEYLTKVLNSLSPDARTFSFETHELTSRRSTAVVIDPDLIPETDLPADLVIAKTTYAADKVSIKAALKGGMTIPGCSLIERTNWSIH
jgi:hypothetical protein